MIVPPVSSLLLTIGTDTYKPGIIYSFNNMSPKIGPGSSDDDGDGNNNDDEAPAILLSTIDIRFCFI